MPVIMLGADMHAQLMKMKVFGTLAGNRTILVAFALLRYVAQIEQDDDSLVFDRKWVLDAYAECLAAVEGKRRPRVSTPRKSGPRAKDKR